ncbi:hypothetical protein CK203_115354 [Vitis vinifera]|uniref:Retrovirus-related Pol polyprotein from transposon TNT 1-94-like beta-barrel domain-containing protein n=1 Tax=Vitis vinifera TaxID=29760 RepID=A0A438CG57_VITVI|nr:hypothetical protein CK203_115354 [Vitis vinifera]
MKNQALELHSPLPKSFKVCKERSKERGKQSEENRGKLAAVFFRTFGALPEVHFLHSIYHFKAQEVKNPMLQTCYGIPPEATRYMLQAGTLRTSSQPNSEDFSTEDERLSFLSLGGRIKWRRCRGSNPESDGAIATAAARDESVTSLTSSYSWFLDIGATHHLTNNATHLSDVHPYHGPDQVSIGSGKKLPIYHIGYTLLSTKYKKFKLNRFFMSQDCQRCH